MNTNCTGAIAAALVLLAAADVHADAAAELRLQKALGYQARTAAMSPNGLVHQAVVDGDTVVELRATSDCAIWTGVQAGAAAMRFSLYRDEASRASLRRAVEGVHLLFQVTGVPGLFGRCAWRNTDAILVDDTAVVHPGAAPFTDYSWRARVSQDQVSGVLFGYALAYELTGDEELRNIIREDLGALARHVRDNDLRIIDVDGEPSPFTDFNPSTVELFGIGVGGFQAAMALSLFKLAAHVTGDPELAGFYQDELVDARGFAALVRDQLHVEVPDALRLFDAGVECDTNYNNYNMMFLVMLPLARLEQDATLAALYRDAMRDHLWNDEGEAPLVGAFPLPGGANHRPVSSQKNAFWTYLTFAAEAEAPDAVALDEARNTLDVFFAPPARGPAEVDNGADFPSQCLDRFEQPMHKDAVIPYERRVPGFFAWTGNPYSVASGAPPEEFPGVDYQVAYWLGRWSRLLPHGDADGDGLDDDREPYFGTDPQRADSDGDGVSDGVEVDVAGTDPAVDDMPPGEGEGEGDEGGEGEGEGEGDDGGEGEGDEGGEGEGEGDDGSGGEAIPPGGGGAPACACLASPRDGALALGLVALPALQLAVPRRRRPSARDAA